MNNDTARHDTARHNGETEYERNQRFNPLVSYHHSRRYSNILALFESVARKTEGKPLDIVEIGCGYAKLFSVLNEQLAIDYTGIEIGAEAVETARSRYAHKSNFRMIHDSAADALPRLQRADIIVALETLEHIPEHDVVRIIEAVAAKRPRLFVCSVPVEIGPAVWLKNVSSLVMGYTRHREYLWRETFWAGLYQLDKMPPHSTGHKGFDWRWLAQTIRHNMKITEIRTLPVPMLPAAVALSVLLVAEPRES
jgi:SAM-dependent methyltransferase